MTNETILVVDDSKHITNFLAHQILPSWGFRALVANNGYSGLKLLREKSDEIRLLIVDLQMPDLGGLDLLRKISTEGINVPAILITAHGSEHIAVEAFRLGVQDYLPKPIDTDQLQAAIFNALALGRLKSQTERLNQQLQEQIAWLNALSEIGRSLTSTLDFDQVLRQIVDAAVSLTNADQGYITLLDRRNQKLVLRVVKNIKNGEIATPQTPVNDALLHQSLTKNQIIRKSRPNDVRSLKAVTGVLVHDLIHVPITKQNHIFGVLSVNKYIESHNFHENDERLLSYLADYAAIAIDNAYLYSQAQSELEERKRVTRALRESEDRYAIAVRGSNDGIWDWNLQDDKIYYSPRWKEMLGYQDSEIESSPEAWFNRIKSTDLEQIKRDISLHIQGKTSHFTNEHRLLHKDETYRWVLCRGIADFDANGVAIRLAGSIADITDRKKAEEQLLHDAFHDNLTGLPNRKLFMDRLDQAIARMQRKSDYRYAVLFLDIDHFKDINDSLGHLVGDQFIIEIAHLLAKNLRSVDTLARFGGDEFLILLDDIQDLLWVSRITDWIKNEFSTPLQIGENKIASSMSIGVVLGQHDYLSAEEVIRNADIAMYVAKARGRDRAEIYDKSMRQRFLKRLVLETDIKAALDTNELRVYYQPIIHLESHNLLGFEALVRWQHSKRGLLAPNEFISLAEETGLIQNIDQWMLQEACTQMQFWLQKYKPNHNLTISINISGKHIANSDFLAYIQNTLNKTGLPPAHLVIEITERSIVDASKVTTYAFKKLQELGVQIQIDDFGVGYSSLGYLPHFPVSAIKIDRSFISGICTQISQRNIVEAIVLLGNRFNIAVIAEGIEAYCQYEQLKNLGCKIGQGYLISNLLKPSDVDILMRDFVALGRPLQFESA